MRALFHVRWLLALALGLRLHAAHATHNQGAEIAYKSIAPTTPGIPRYHVLVRLFLDPTNQTLSSAITLVATRGGCDATAPNKVVVPDIPRNQPTPGYAINCGNLGVNLIYYTAIYETDLDLPTGAWTLGITQGNRADNIQNIVNAVSHNSFVNAYLNSSLAAQDSSPQFQATLLPHVGGNAAQRYSFSAYDADGDSLSYSFILPREVLGGTDAISTCGSNLSSSYAPQYQLDVRTGVLTSAGGGNTQQGRFNMSGQVSEYRRIGGQWQLIGFVTRDLTYLAYATTNRPPDFTSLTVDGGAAQPIDQTIAARPGQLLALTLTAADPDAGQQLSFACASTTIIPGLSLATLSGTQVRLTWQVPATLPPGRYTLPVAVLDDGCPQRTTQERTLLIVVANQALATRPATNAESQAYPVPFREQVQFQAAPGQAVTLVDALGRVVARLSADGSGRVLWQPAAGLPAGLYLARAANGQALARLLRE
ncbi:hypothetical protein HHL22_13500 [Hymenobacter sp. RP-2-7]|uniref:T9SS type A sorting domain-containing protein n=1 Tax=Hymenobacter polaris TaxID=2682546 RepID=A0A7Y0FMT6_9BACT|nr:hypothetical protein [Hymenobacter polaris]NML66222.1 hypothetical protein [Hymenobacter polaris]